MNSILVNLYSRILLVVGLIAFLAFFPDLSKFLPYAPNEKQLISACPKFSSDLPRVKVQYKDYDNNNKSEKMMPVLTKQQIEITNNSKKHPNSQSSKIWIFDAKKTENHLSSFDVVINGSSMSSISSDKRSIGGILCTGEFTSYKKCVATILGSDLTLYLLNHSWSGLANIIVNGASKQVDLDDPADGVIPPRLYTRALMKEAAMMQLGRSFVLPPDKSNAPPLFFESFANGSIDKSTVLSNEKPFGRIEKNFYKNRLTIKRITYFAIIISVVFCFLFFLFWLNHYKKFKTKTDANYIESWGMAALEARRHRSKERVTAIASRRQEWINSNRYFYSSLSNLLRHIVESGSRVLVLRSETGELLKAVSPSVGVGMEISPEIIAEASKINPEYRYIEGFPDDKDFKTLIKPTEKYDYIIINQVNDIVQLEVAIENVGPLCEKHSRVLLYTYNSLWAPVVRLAERLNLKVHLDEQSWLTEADLSNMLYLGGFELVSTYRILLMPKYIPLLSLFLNRFVAKLPLFNRLCMTTVLVARKVMPPVPLSSVSVSVIIPCKDERGNVEDAVCRVPELGHSTEIIFCDDKSTDGTADEVRRMQLLYPNKNIRLIEGPGICKAKNVWTGFRGATGDILLILDADLTTMPEELPRFINALLSGKAEFANGSRLVYPMPPAAMKATNMLGNKFFSLAFSYLLDQRVKDTLCGTKVLWRSDWERIDRFLGTWGTEDRWGDYELLFGAAKLNLRIVDVSVHYQERVYGVTKMTNVFKNGLIMLRMVYRGFIGLKLGY